MINLLSAPFRLSRAQFRVSSGWAFVGASISPNSFRIAQMMHCLGQSTSEHYMPPSSLGCHFFNLAEVRIKKFVLSVAWSSDGRRIACCSMDGTVSIFDVARAKFLHHLEGHFMLVWSLVYSPVEPRLLFTASDNAHVHMYDAEGKALIGALTGHGSWVLNVDVSPDGTPLATGSSDRTVMLWDLSMRASIQTMKNHNDQVWGVAFKPQGGSLRGGRLVSVSDDKSISLYDYS